ncbi:DUF134 domain-containing protein [Collinsella sp. OF03-4AA]|nr:DUF134 domain-containing protein [Collinsella sp. OF03-4AA]
MAGRREKLRRVGIIPEYRGFTPDGLASGDAIDMTIDELEVLRLCDLEGLNQEAVAQRMGIARATVAAICSRAHRKVANALVNGRALSIEGGNIAYSPITTTTAAWPAKEVGTMRVATTYDNGNIFMHFGRSEQFKIYDIQDGKVLNEQVVGTGGTGHGALAGLLANGGVDTLICGGIGAGAINALAQAGITVYAGAQAAATLASRPLSPARSHRTARPRATATATTTSTPMSMAGPAAATATTTTKATRAAAATNGTAPRARGAKPNATQQSKPTTKATR